MSRTAQRSQKRKESAAVDLGVIVSHPTRRRCWSALYGRTMSPKQLADEFSYSTQHVDYHMKILAKFGLVEIAFTEKVRGATEHFYRVVERYNLDRADVEALSPEEATASLTHIFQLQVADVAASLDSGKAVERPDHHVARHPMDLDEEGWAVLYELCEEFSQRVDQLRLEAIERTAGDPSARNVEAMLHVNFVEMPDRDDRVKQF